eukprot:jgi/Mesvir1/26467/Mv16140-RA.2
MSRMHSAVASCAVLSLLLLASVPAWAHKESKEGNNDAEEPKAPVSADGCQFATDNPVILAASRHSESRAVALLLEKAGVFLATGGVECLASDALPKVACSPTPDMRDTECSNADWDYQLTWDFERRDVPISGTVCYPPAELAKHDLASRAIQRDVEGVIKRYQRCGCPASARGNRFGFKHPAALFAVPLLKGLHAHMSLVHLVQDGRDLAAADDTAELRGPAAAVLVGSGDLPSFHGRAMEYPDASLTTLKQIFCHATWREHEEPPGCDVCLLECANAHVPATARGQVVGGGQEEGGRGVGGGNGGAGQEEGRGSESEERRRRMARRRLLHKPAQLVLARHYGQTNIPKKPPFQHVAGKPKLVPKPKAQHPPHPTRRPVKRVPHAKVEDDDGSDDLDRKLSALIKENIWAVQGHGRSAGARGPGKFKLAENTGGLGNPAFIECIASCSRYGHAKRARRVAPSPSEREGEEGKEGPEVELTYESDVDLTGLIPGGSAGLAMAASAKVWGVLNMQVAGCAEMYYMHPNEYIRVRVEDFLSLDTREGAIRDLLERLGLSPPGVASQATLAELMSVFDEQDEEGGIEAGGSRRLVESPRGKWRGLKAAHLIEVAAWPALKVFGYNFSMPLLRDDVEDDGKTWAQEIAPAPDKGVGASGSEESTRGEPQPPESDAPKQSWWQDYFSWDSLGSNWYPVFQSKPKVPMGGGFSQHPVASSTSFNSEEMSFSNWVPTGTYTYTISAQTIFYGCLGVILFLCGFLCNMCITSRVAPPRASV